MPGCAVDGCKNYTRSTKGSDLKYFRFPREDHLRNQWVMACRRKTNINLKNATICSVHFEEKCIEIPLKQRLLNYTPRNARHLRADAVPTLHLPGGLSDTITMQKSEEASLDQKKIRLVHIKSEVEDNLISSSNTSTCVLEIHTNEAITEQQLFLIPKTEPMTEEDHPEFVDPIHIDEAITEQQLFLIPKTEPMTEQDQTELVGLRRKINILESQNKLLIQEIQKAKAPPLGTNKKVVKPERQYEGSLVIRRCRIGYFFT